MGEKRKIQITEIVSDFRSGMTDMDLMAKWGLSSAGLQSVFRKLLKLKAIEKAEMEGRYPEFTDTVDLAQLRELPRNYVVFLIPVSDTEDPSMQGEIEDITEKGLRVRGAPDTVGTKRRLFIPAEEFHGISGFQFTAECRWVNPAESPENAISGYEIVEIGDDARAQLQALVRSVTFGENDI